MAHFLGKISPPGDQKNKGTTTPTEDSFIKNGTRSPFFEEKKVEFVTFRPYL
jgi:hypothetical protein